MLHAQEQSTWRRKKTTEFNEPHLLVRALSQRHLLTFTCMVAFVISSFKEYRMIMMVTVMAAAAAAAVVVVVVMMIMNVSATD